MSHKLHFIKVVLHLKDLKKKITKIAVGVVHRLENIKMSTKHFIKWRLFLYIFALCSLSDQSESGWLKKVSQATGAPETHVC